ncbi:hypothetical protein BDD12DRAFT_865702 [Trichophaea hybrida]|nr:hypothetical protein BDD12DRAFT_865702 [Trichophaea hybrida]
MHPLTSILPFFLLLLPTSLCICSKGRIPSFKYSTSSIYSSEFAEAAYSRALAHGVDPTSPMPDDFLKDDGEKITFAGKSNFALWLAAQNARTDAAYTQHQKIKRQSGLEVSIFTGTECNGSGFHWYNLPYSRLAFDPNPKPTKTDPTGNQPCHSMQILGGTVNPKDERLYLKRWNGGVSETCQDLNHYVYGPPGCAKRLPTFTCFELAQVSVFT